MTWMLDGSRHKVPRSTKGYSKPKLQPVVDAFIALMEGQGLETPNPIGYERWKQSAPPAGECYPPLARLIETYDRERIRPRS